MWPKIVPNQASSLQYPQFAGAVKSLFHLPNAWRTDPRLIPLMSLIGMVAVPGLHCFVLGQVGLGLLYLLTYGVLLFGTIADIVKSPKSSIQASKLLQWT